MGAVTSLIALVLIVGVGACSSGVDGDGPTGSHAGAWTTAERTFFHEGIAAGPTLFSSDDGSILEERRYEPYGTPIEAYRESGGVASVGDVDFRREPRNGLNKDTDPNTGWSYHGARWMAPQTARWLTPDPPTRAPDPRFLTAPWDLNPYAYVRGNPLLYWDEDGRDFKEFMAGFAVGAAEAGLDAVAQRLEALTTAISLAGAAITAAREHRFGDAVIAAQRFYEQVDPAHVAVSDKIKGIIGTIDAFRTFGDDFAEAIFAPTDFEAGKISVRVATKAMTIAGTIAEMGEVGAKAASAARARASSAPGKVGCVGGACSGRTCFVEGTLVVTRRGMVPINEIVVGDLVLSKDELTGETTYRRVDEVYRRRAHALETVDLVAADGAVDHLTTTEEHPFFIEGEGWVSAGELAIGDRVVGANGEALTVAVAALRTEEADVWNFRVEEFHSYFVGDHGAWVHNSYGAGAAPKGLRPEAKYLRGGKHGLSWKEGIAEAKSSGKSQGQWGSKADLEYAGHKAATLKPGQGSFFDLPADSKSVVHRPDGSTVPATRMWVRNNGGGTFHGAPWE